MKGLQKFFLSLCVAFTVFIGCGMAVHAADYSDLFDATYYAQRNPDVVAVYGTDSSSLYSHYIKCGINEGRNAGPLFDVKQYRYRNSDLENLYGNDWAAYVNHYLTTGLKEGRVGYGEDFDAVSYANRYSDLKNVYGYDLKALYNHYLSHGKNEGRIATYETTRRTKQDTTNQNTPTAASNGHYVSRKARQLFAITNEERRAWDLRDLKWDVSLAELAAERVTELPVRFDHVRLNGQSIYEYHVAEENISMWSAIPEEVHNNFMSYWDSADRITDPGLRRVGISCYEVGGVYYWCVLFGE